MLRRHHINADPGGRSARFLLGVADVVRWPFERAAWFLERRLLWPLRERSAGWRPPDRGAGAAALAAIAGAAVLAGVLLLPGSESPRERAVAPARVAIATPEPEPQAEPQGRVLQGIAPSFDAGVSPADAIGGGEIDAEGAEAPAAPAAGGPESSAAAASSAEPVPAGPAAMKVARRFSEAFLFYEIGERRGRAKTVFDETATPELAGALAERPPRQPEGAEVPKAHVVNLVPGPRAGKAYTVSVSLLRLGLTTELRLELSKKSGSWVVTDVRG